MSFDRLKEIRDCLEALEPGVRPGVVDSGLASVDAVRAALQPEGPTGDYPKDTLGYHREMTIALMGADSAAVKFLDGKIKESVYGSGEVVIAHESQMIQLLFQIHNGG